MIDEDRLKHSLAVARKMVEIGKSNGLAEDELKDLFMLGYNHDIGYEFGTNENHNVIGANILKQNNYKYWQEVYYHGQINVPYSSLYLDILNMADMQIDKFGNDVGYNKRLEDIKNRYGENSEVYRKVEILVNELRKDVKWKIKCIWWSTIK